MRISDWSSDVCSSDLAHALALGVEVRSALAAAHRQPGQRIFERLFERQEFEHAFGDARVKADTALIGSDRIVVLNAPAALDADMAVVVLPADAEGHDPVGPGDAQIEKAACWERVCQ